MILATNLSALFVENALTQTTAVLGQQEAELATGNATPSPADNPADQAEATLMQGELGVLSQNAQNVAEGINFLQTAAGAQQQAMALLQQLSGLAVQASNGSLTPQDRAALEAQAQQVLQALSVLNTQTQYNEIPVFGAMGTGPSLTGGSASLTMVGNAEGLAITAITVDPATNTLVVSGTGLPTVLNKGNGSVVTLPYNGDVDQWAFSDKTNAWQSGNALMNNGDPNDYESGSATSATIRVDTGGLALNPGNTVALQLVDAPQFVWPSTTTTFTFAPSGTFGIDSITVDPATDTLIVSGAGLPTTLTNNGTSVALPYNGDVDQWAFDNETQGWVSGNAPDGNFDWNDYEAESATSATIQVNTSQGRPLNPGDVVTLAWLYPVQATFVWPSTTTTFTFGTAVTAQVGSGTGGSSNTADAGNPLVLQIGPAAGDILAVSTGAVSPAFLGLASVSLSTTSAAQKTLATIQAAITYLSTWQARVGSQLDALHAQAQNLTTQRTQLSASRATLHDADIAAVASAFARQQVLLQTGIQALLRSIRQPRLIQRILRV